jgi:hypothetical protein
VLQSKPELFYSVAFVIMYGMGALFWGIRGPVHALVQSGTTGHHSHLFRQGILMFAAICAIAISTLFLVRSGSIKPRTQAENGDNPTYIGQADGSSRG